MKSFLIQDSNDSDTLIISFGGRAKEFGGILPFEFLNFLNKNFEKYNKHFYIDIHQVWYHKGIVGLSTNIEETVIYFKSQIKKYKNVIFLGISAGGYAAILFGSLLNVQKVIAIVPQTYLHGEEFDERYTDLQPFLNKKTNYYIYGDIEITDKNHIHHFSHCAHIDNAPNIQVIEKKGIDMRTMRDNGELLTILKEVIE